MPVNYNAGKDPIDSAMEFLSAVMERPDVKENGRIEGIIVGFKLTIRMITDWQKHPEYYAPNERGDEFDEKENQYEIEQEQQELIEDYINLKIKQGFIYETLNAFDDVLLDDIIHYLGRAIPILSLNPQERAEMNVNAMNVNVGGSRRSRKRRGRKASTRRTRVSKNIA